MKKKLIFLTAFAFGSFIAFCQDSSHTLHEKVIFRNNPQIHSTVVPAQTTDGSSSASPIYRDTRLGSSSPKYNTYKKNDYGAGAITTNPNKNDEGSADLPHPSTDSIK